MKSLKNNLIFFIVLISPIFNSAAVQTNQDLASEAPSTKQEGQSADLKQQ